MGTSPDIRRRGGRRTALAWAAILVVAGVALAFGSGALGSPEANAPTLYQRTMQVAGQYRCPVCQGETVAASDAPEAVEIKSLIRRWLQEGRDQGQIRGYLVAHYGGSILEKPPTSGLSTVVWALPALAAALGVAGLGFGFRRWRRALVHGEVTARPAVAQADRPNSAWITKLKAQGVPAQQSSRRQRYERATLFAGVTLIVIAGGLWWLDRSSAPRLPGDTITGGQTGLAAELAQASALAGTNPVAALAIYDGVLASDPEQPDALTAEGWLYAAAGLSTKGMTLLDRAEKVDPDYAPAHFYRALVLLDYEGKPAQAVTELKWYLSHGPEPSLAAAAHEALREAEASTNAR
jgi:cytochrome c-type biogenesis protein CcmH